MPKGIRGFQPGRKKTGGREKGEPIKANLTNAFKDRLKRYGFNFDKELAQALKLMCHGKPAPQYSELRALLPYTYPKLKEIEPPTPEDSREAESPITTEALLEAMNGSKRTDKALGPSGPRKGELPTLEEGRVDPQDATSPTGDLPVVAGEQEEDA
jgi:hypothetical protein